ncbi:MAG: hypothetical protein BWZ10_01099 [candidate division BRC1 bacterium ADurb.BinA364]|nr:MAG: hypothetical protein BWZ10_01099 [candidate division BRC1 bacterium ADurb.BinA364]
MSEMRSLLSRYAAIAIAAAAMSSAALAAPTVIFQADFEAAVAESPTTLANINLGTPVGSWIGFDETRSLGSTLPSTGIHVNSASTGKGFIQDRNADTSAAFSLDANFSQPAVLADGLTVTFKCAPRRTGANKPCTFEGKDASGAVSFAVRFQTFAGSIEYFEWYNGSAWAPTGTGTDETGFMDIINSDNLETITLTLGASGYTFDYVPGLDQAGAAAPATNAPYTKSGLTYVGAPTQITKITMSGNTQTGVVLDDFIVTALGGASVGDWDKM